LAVKESANSLLTWLGTHKYILYKNFGRKDERETEKFKEMRYNQKSERSLDYYNILQQLNHLE